MENKRIFFSEASDREIKKLVDNSEQRNTKKSTKCAGTILFILWNYLQGYQKNKPLFSWLVHQSMYPRLEDCPQNFTVALKALLLGQLFILQTIFQPWALSANIPATKRVCLLNIPYKNFASSNYQSYDN